MTLATAATGLARRLVPWHVFPLMLAAMYGAPAALGALTLGDLYAGRVFVALALSVAGYYAGAWAGRLAIDRIGGGWLRTPGPLRRWHEIGAVTLVAAYVLLVAYLSLTAERIALFAAFDLGSASEISAARETLLQTRTGPERALIYLNAILFRVVLPFIVVFLYMRRSRWRHAVLGALLFASLLSMEKSLPLFLLVPMFIYALLVGRSATAFRLLALTLAILAATVLLATGMLGHVAGRPFAEEEQLISDRPGDRKNLFWVLSGMPATAGLPQRASNREGDALAETWGALGRRNLLLNPEMAPAGPGFLRKVPGQSGALFPPWYVLVTRGSHLAFELVTDAPPGFSYSLKATVVKPHEPAPPEVFELQQRLAGYRVRSLEFGTPAARPLVASFWVKASIPGTYSLSIANGAYTRSFLATYVVRSKDDWQRVEIRIPGDASGADDAWPRGMSNALVLNFSLGAGQAYQSAADGAWKGGFFRQRDEDAVSLIRSAGATWQITGVQLESGIAATPFERHPIGAEKDLLVRFGPGAGKDTSSELALSRRAAFIANRVLWIPYITAYDWFRFHDEVLKGEFLKGRTAGLLAWARGLDRYPMEKEAFRYQFGEAASATGTSNAVYFADAYVNFGWAGVVATSVLIGVFFSILGACASLPANAVSVMSSFGLMVASLTANLLSGGLVVLLLLAFVTRGVRSG
jgi:hypothetical protein